MEQITLAWNALVLDKTTGKITDIDEDNFENELNNRGIHAKVDYANYSTNSDFSVTFIDTTHEYIVDRNGKVTLKGIKVIENDQLVTVEPTEIIYVTLYDDGTLAFSNNDIKALNNNITKAYTIQKNDLYKDGDEVPWKDERSIITKAVFENTIVPTSTARWFQDCNNLKKIDNIENLNTSQAISIRCMFLRCENLENIDLHNFNTINVTDIGGMFDHCVKLKNIDISSFKTNNVENMAYMFSGCLFSSIILSNLDTSNVKNMAGLFANCTNINHLDLSNFNTSNVTNMDHMFEGCSSLTSLNLSSFNTNNVNYMDYMFNGCSSLTSLNLSNFNTSNVTNMKAMFMGCQNITTLDFCSFDTKNVTNMESMFSSWIDDDSGFGNGMALKTIYIGEKWNTSLVTSSNEMFSHCNNLVGANGTTYNSSKVNKEYARIDKSGQKGYFTDGTPHLRENNTELDYIESTGTQYIDTRIIPTNNTGIKIDFQYTDVSGKQYITGLYDTNKFRFHPILIDNGELEREGKFLYCKTLAFNPVAFGNSDLSRHVITYNYKNDNLITFDNNDIEVYSNFNNSSTNSSIYIFARNYQGPNLYAKAKIYGASFTQNGNLIRNYIPVHNSITNTSGLYDTVEGKFYANSGTDAFTEGPEKH